MWCHFLQNLIYYLQTWLIFNLIKLQFQEIVGGLMGDLENDEGKFHSSRAGFGLIVLNIH